VLVEKLNGNGFVYSKIEVKRMIYFCCFDLSYSLPKMRTFFLIYYKFANVYNFSRFSMGVAGAKPLEVAPNPFKWG
jgi:hypothetical protein